MKYREIMYFIGHIKTADSLFSYSKDLNKQEYTVLLQKFLSRPEIRIITDPKYLDSDLKLFEMLVAVKNQVLFNAHILQAIHYLNGLESTAANTLEKFEGTPKVQGMMLLNSAKETVSEARSIYETLAHYRGIRLDEVEEI